MSLLISTAVKPGISTTGFRNGHGSAVTELQVVLICADEDVVDTNSSLISRLEHDLAACRFQIIQRAINPGENRQDSVRQLVDQAHIVLVCISTQAFSKSGRRRLKTELDTPLRMATNRSRQGLLVIPVVRSGELPPRLQRYQPVDLRESDGYQRLVDTIAAMRADLGITGPSSPWYSRAMNNISKRLNGWKKLASVIVFVITIAGFLGYSNYHTVLSELRDDATPVMGDDATPVVGDDATPVVGIERNELGDEVLAEPVSNISFHDVMGKLLVMKKITDHVAITCMACALWIEFLNPDPLTQSIRS